MTILEAKQLSKSYGEIRAVDGVSLGVDAGEIYGLLGPNGAGKTTCISMICGLLRPDRGTVLISGKDFWSDPIRAQKAMGVVPQEVALYEDLSGWDNLIFWGKLAGLRADEAKRRASELLDALQLADRAKDLLKTYSGGMKRRINIGCALLHRPALLLLDEPTVGIDPQARFNILEFVRGLAKDGTAILYTTHYLEEAESLCHRIGIVDHGKILAEGTLAELQGRVGGKTVFHLEGDFREAKPEEWPDFLSRFRVIQRTDEQLLVSALQDRHPSDALRDLLQLPVATKNVSVKQPTLNDVFLQLTGRQLRE